VGESGPNTQTQQAPSGAGTTPAAPSICANDVAVDGNSALLFSQEAPLPVSASIIQALGTPSKEKDPKKAAAENAKKVASLDDYKAVWAFVPKDNDPKVLIYFHGNNNYVTVDKSGSRNPAWADATAIASINAAPKTEAAGLKYKLNKQEQLQQDEQDQLEDSNPAKKNPIKKPLVLVPEDVELVKVRFWAVPPRNQYGDSQTTGTQKLENLVMDCYKHLRCLSTPSGTKYLPSGPGHRASFVSNLKRVYLSGHSGGGKPLVEAAGADLVLMTPTSIDLPTDVWLFDCTYGFGIKNYVSFCQNWNDNKRLANKPDSSRFVCVYRPKSKESDTESEADALRVKLAQVLGVKSPDSLRKEHLQGNLSSLIIPTLVSSPVVFVRTTVPHDKIPTTFFPVLLLTAAS
jgi:hypothetical protein